MVAGLSRRRFGALAGTAGLASLTGLAGCGSGSDPNHLRAAFYGAPDVNAALAKAFGQLRAEHAELGVATESGAFTGYFDKLATRFGAGTAPDVVMMDFTHIAGYARRGALLDLTRYVPDPIDPDAARPSVFGGGRVRGKLYGVPIGTHTQGLMLRTDLARKHGLDVPDVLTWGRLEELCTGLARDTGGRLYGVEDGGGKDFALDVFVRQHGGQLFTTAGRLGFGRDVLVEWFDFWQRMRRAGGATSIDLTANTTVGAMVTGQAVMAFNFSNVTGLQAQTPAPLRMMAVPAGSARDRPGAYQYIKPTDLFSVSRQTAAPDKAARIVAAFLTEPAVASRVGTTLGSPPATKVFDQLRAGAKGIDRQVVDFDAMVQRNATAAPYPPIRPLGADQLLTATGALLGRLNLSVGYGQLTPKAAAEQFFSQATSYLAT
jgi:multiple sugar transport system substrate-binding protein